MEIQGKKISGQQLLAGFSILLPISLCILKWNLVEASFKVAGILIVVNHFLGYIGKAQISEQRDFRVVLELIFEKNYLAIYSTLNKLLNYFRDVILVKEKIFSLKFVKSFYILSLVSSKIGDAYFFIIISNIIIWLPQLIAFYNKVQEEKRKKAEEKAKKEPTKLKNAVKKVKSFAHYLIKLKRDGPVVFLPVLKKVFLKIEQNVPRYSNQEIQAQ